MYIHDIHRHVSTLTHTDTVPYIVLHRFRLVSKHYMEILSHCLALPDITWTCKYMHVVERTFVNNQRRQCLRLLEALRTFRWRKPSKTLTLPQGLSWEGNHWFLGHPHGQAPAMWMKLLLNFQQKNLIGWGLQTFERHQKCKWCRCDNLKTLYHSSHEYSYVIHHFWYKTIDFRKLWLTRSVLWGKLQGSHILLHSLQDQLLVFSGLLCNLATLS